MDEDVFMNMLFGGNPAEAYIKSKEGKKEITINSSIMAVIQILIDKGIVTSDEFNKYQEKHEEILINVIRKEVEKELKDLKDE